MAPSTTAATPPSKQKKTRPHAKQKKTLSKSEKAWFVQFQELQNCPDWTDLSQVTLRWMDRQRKAHARKKLNEERFQLLNSVEGFYWSANDECWERKFRELQKLIAQTGSCCVPFRKSTATDTNKVFLPHMAWATEQRSQYVLFQKGMHSRTSQWRIDKLNSVGFNWTSTDASENEKLEEQALFADFQWLFRFLPQDKHREILRKITSTEEEVKRTGKVKMILIDGRFLCRKEDGVYYLEYGADEGQPVPPFAIVYGDIKGNSTCRRMTYDSSGTIHLHDDDPLEDGNDSSTVSGKSTSQNDEVM